MGRSVVALLAICAMPAFGMADERLTPGQIVDFFTKDAAASPPAAPARTRGLAIGQPAAAGDRSVFLGAAGFGDDAGAPAAPPAAGLDLLVTFDLDSTRLTDEARGNLDAFAEALHDPALASMRFAVEGHTDATGPADYNLSLSRRRARAVVDYLVAHGIDRQRLTPKGFGETRPRAPDPLDPANRRVETRRLP